MKKQLLTVILALSAISFSAATQLPDSELLTCLKHGNIDIQRHLQDIAQQKQELKKKWYKNYTRAIKTWKKLYSFFETRQKEENKKWDAEVDPFNLNIICNQINSLGAINVPNEITNELFYFLRKYTAPCQTTHRKVEAIISKYFKDMTIDEFMDAFDNYRVVSIIAEKPYLLKLLKKIDVKIAKLQKA